VTHIFRVLLRESNKSTKKLFNSCPNLYAVAGDLQAVAAANKWGQTTTQPLMLTSSIVYTGHLRTTATHELSGNTLITDAPPDNNGRGEAFSPTDLLATSLGSCMLTIMGIVAERHNIDITGTRVAVQKVMASAPRRVSEVHVDFELPAGSYSEKDRQLLENAAHTCPVAMSLHPDIKQQVSFHWPA
jgi:putative redox protein